MNVLIAYSGALFASAPADALAATLARQLDQHGHRAELLRLPCRNDNSTELLMVRALELSNVERLIALDFPAALLRHPHKRLWLTGAPGHASDPGVAAVLRAAGADAIAESVRCYAASEAAQAALLHAQNCSLALLRAPLAHPEWYENQGDDGYLYAGGMLDARHLHLLEALEQASPAVQLVLAGAPVDAALDARLQQACASPMLRDRVRFAPALAGPAQAAMLARARAVLCIGADAHAAEQAVQAAVAGKAALADGPCPLDLVRHRQSGWVAHPGAAALALAMNQAIAHPNWCALYGAQAAAQLTTRGWTWPATLKTLLA